MTQNLLHYKHVVLADPCYSEIRSRDTIKKKLNIDFLGFKFKSMAIPANMQCSIDFEMAEKLDSMGFFYILHRFYDYDEIYDWLNSRQKYEGRYPINSISVGVRDKDYAFIDRLFNGSVRVDYITIDIAFGHSILMKEMIKYIRDHLPDTKIIAGNVCTSDAVIDLTEWGADAIKVGLSMGKACTTYNSTGVGSPMFSTVLKCSDVRPSIPAYKNGNFMEVERLYKLADRLKNIPIIADGGIRENGDVCKALVAGASMVMIGSDFVKCVDSPTEHKHIFDKGENTHVLNKLYFGSASAKNKGEDKYVEGKEGVWLQTNHLTYEDYFRKINESIASCMSYHNLTDIRQMKTIKWSTHSM